MTEQHKHHAPKAGDKGSKQDAIGFVDGLAIGAVAFFGCKTEIVDPEVAAGRKVGIAAVPEEAV